MKAARRTLVKLTPGVRRHTTINTIFVNSSVNSLICLNSQEQHNTQHTQRMGGGRSVGIQMSTWLFIGSSGSPRYLRILTISGPLQGK